MLELVNFAIAAATALPGVIAGAMAGVFRVLGVGWLMAVAMAAVAAAAARVPWVSVV